MEKVRQVRAKKFGDFIRELRKKKDWSLRDVEEKSGGKISNAYLSQIERGGRNVPNLEIVTELSNVFKEPLESFLSVAGFLAGKSFYEPTSDYYQKRIERLSDRNKEFIDGVINLLLEQEEKFK